MKDIHENSIVSYSQEKQSGRVETFQRRILVFLESATKPLTDRQIWTALGIWDVNNVRPHITKLKHLGLVKEVGKTKCLITGKTVRLVMYNKETNNAFVITCIKQKGSW